MSLRDLILGLDDRQRVPLVIPEWRTPEAPGGMTVYVSSLTSARQIEYSAAAKAYPNATASLLLAVFTAEDEAGHLIFKPDDIPLLLTRNMVPMRRIWAIADPLTPSVEDIRKNHTNGQ